MKVLDVMTRDVCCCTPNTKLNEVARMMVEHDCGEIPVIDPDHGHRLVGVITDRDIVCRAISDDCKPSECTAGEYMSTPIVCVSPQHSVEECAHRMEQYMVRRIPVADANGVCCGIVSQADLARRAVSDVEHVLKELSRPTFSPSLVGSGAQS